MPPATCQSNFGRETTWLLGGKVFQGGATFLSGAIVARQLGPDSFGILASAMLLATLISASTTFGLEHPVSRYSAQNHGAWPRRAWTIRLITGALGTLVLIALAAIATKETAPNARALLFLAALPLAQCGDIFEWQLISRGRARAVAIVGALTAVIFASARMAIAITNPSVTLLALLLAFEWTSRSILLYGTHRVLKISNPATPDPTEPTVRGWLASSLPLWLSALAVTAYSRSDQLLISQMLGSRELGIYVAATSLFEITLAIPLVVLRSALPALARAKLQNDSLLTSITISLLKRCFFLALALTVIVATAATKTIHIVFGPDYIEAARVLVWQFAALPFITIGSISTAWLLSKNLGGHILARTLLGLGVNLTLLVLLIPRFGLSGAAFSFFVSQFIATFLADALWANTRILFNMKCRAICPFIVR